MDLIPQEQGVYTPQNGYQIIYMPRKNRKWVWITIALLVAAVAAVMLILMLPGADPADYYRIPVFYQQNESVFMAAGVDSIELKDADTDSNGYIRGFIDEGRNWLYYISNFSNKKGDLMRLRLGNAGAEPELCVSGVYCAVGSYDGSKVLYLTDYDGTSGELYVYPGADDTLSESALPEMYGFSPEGNYLYFIEQDGDTTTLYVNGRTSIKADSISDSSYRFTDINVFDDGSIIYTITNPKESSSVIYIYKSGKTEKIDEGNIIKVLGTSEFLYCDSNNLYYWKNGDRKTLSKHYKSVCFAAPTGYYRDPRTNIYDRFLIEEFDGSEYTFSEYTLSGGKEEIADVENGYFGANSKLEWVYYLSGEQIYLAHKTGNRWETEIEPDEQIYYGMFNITGRYYYYATKDYELHRYSLDSGEDIKLADDAIHIWEVGGVLYAENSDTELYRVDQSGTERIAKDFVNIVWTFDDGYYIVTGDEGSYDIDYYSPGSKDGKIIAEDVEKTIWVTGEIGLSK